MKNLMDYSLTERQEIIFATSDKLNLDPVIIEKDYWVSWLLNLLFFSETLKNSIVFKGGTSLSKGYGIIKRFSEDVDISISRKLINFKEDVEYYKSLSRNQRQKQIREQMEPIFLDFIENKFKGMLYQLISGNIDPDTFTLEYKDERGKEHILFKYPKTIDTELDYIGSYVKIEPGIKSVLSPISKRKIIPFIYQEFPSLDLDKKYADISCLSIERTFFEKITILHSEFHIASKTDKLLKPGLSRHYYDVFKLIQNGLSIENFELFKEVVEHKKVFYADNKANYDEALTDIKLVPHEKKFNELINDYKEMNVMFYDIPPDFDEIIEALKKYEVVFKKQLNKLN